MVLKMQPRRGDIMVEYYWRYKLKPRRGGIIKSQDDFNEIFCPNKLPLYLLLKFYQF